MFVFFFCVHKLRRPKGKGKGDTLMLGKNSGRVKKRQATAGGVVDVVRLSMTYSGD